MTAQAWTMPLTFLNTMTIAFWVKKDSEKPDYVRYVGKGTGTQRNYGVWDETTTGNRVLFQVYSSSGPALNFYSSGGIEVGRWYHVACTYDRSVGRIYIDGTLSREQPGTLPPVTTADPLTFAYGGIHSYLAGSLDEVRIYNRALAGSEIANLAQAPVQYVYGLDLISQARNGGTHYYGYDGHGSVRIVEKNNGAVTSNKTFLWCGLELAEERDASGATVTKRFFPEGEQINGTVCWFLRDHLGSVRQMVHSLITSYDYDPYGRRTKQVGSLEADFGFTGHYVHAPTGLHLAPFRAYDPNIGRWLSRDPIAEEDGFNLYIYVDNSPVGLVDPLGLFGDGRSYGPEADRNSPWFGHSDFTGSQWFDYTREDHDPRTAPSPGGAPANHFQDRLSSLLQARAAIRDCDRFAFERAMHRLQDYNSHYAKGKRWNPGRGQFGHLWSMSAPDHDNGAWQRAEQETAKLVGERVASK